MNTMRVNSQRARAVWLGVLTNALWVTAVAGATPEARKFDINEIDVEGNTVLPLIDIERAVYPFLGPERTMADIESARAALEKAYAEHGFQTVYVAIPQQTVRGGIVRLKAVEARIGSVDVKSRSRSTKRRVRAGVPSLTEGSVPNLHALNAQLVELNSRRADLQVTPRMAPGKEPQTIDVNLDVADKFPVHGSLELNNRYSRDTHPLRALANLSYDDLWNADHSLSLLYSVAPQSRDDGEVYAVTYAAPVPDTDVKLSLTGLKSNSDISALGTTGVLGRGQSVTLSASLPLGVIGSYFHYVQAGWAYKHFNNTVKVADLSDSAPITYYPVSVTYGGSYRGTVSQLTFDTGVTFGLRGLGSDHAAYDYTRFRADGNLAYARAGITWLRNLPRGFDVSVELSGQRGNGPLVSNEQFALGGDGSVRGYLQSEAVGDDGVRGSLELRSPTLAPLLGSAFDDLRLVLFSDAGRAVLRDPLPEQQDHFSLSSVGIGLTAQAFGMMRASVFFADPLESTNGPGRGGSTSSGDTRVQFRVSTQF